MLHDFAILYSEKVDHGVTSFPWATDPTAMKNDHISLRKCALDLHVGFLVGAAKPGNEFHEPLPAVLNHGGVLGVRRPAVLREGALRMSYLFIAIILDKASYREGSSQPPEKSIPVALHKSMTTSPIGCEQQTRRLPSAGLSSGSGS